MMIKAKTKAIKHIRNSDVAFVPQAATARYPGGITYTGMWLNVVNPDAVYIIERDLIFIKTEDRKNWKDVVYDV